MSIGGFIGEWSNEGVLEAGQLVGDVGPPHVYLQCCNHYSGLLVVEKLQ